MWLPENWEKAQKIEGKCGKILHPVSYFFLTHYKLLYVFCFTMRFLTLKLRKKSQKIISPWWKTWTIYGEDNMKYHTLHKLRRTLKSNCFQGVKKNVYVPMLCSGISHHRKYITIRLWNGVPCKIIHLNFRGKPKETLHSIWMANHWGIY